MVTMKSAQSMTTMQLMDWLHKTAQSISKHAGRGNMLNGSRSQDLVDRYQELRAEAMARKLNGVTAWEVFCSEQGGVDPSHDAYDFWA